MLTPSDQSQEEREALDHEPNAHVDPVMRGFVNGAFGIGNRRQGLSADPTRPCRQLHHDNMNYSTGDR